MPLDLCARELLLDGDSARNMDGQGKSGFTGINANRRCTGVRVHMHGTKGDCLIVRVFRVTPSNLLEISCEMYGIVFYLSPRFYRKVRVLIFVASVGDFFAII